MTLQDEMMRTIRRAIIAKPDVCAALLRTSAVRFEQAYAEYETIHRKIEDGSYTIGDYTKRTVARRRWQDEHRTFKALLAEHADELRAFCTENE